ncbi:hypothetical protein Agub_g15652, partial [Astrephomene gubernaculifera]
RVLSFDNNCLFTMSTRLRAPSQCCVGTACPLRVNARSRITPTSFQRRCLRVAVVKASASAGADGKQPLHTRVAIIGGGPAAHTAAIYAARAELEPIVFEGFMAAGIAPGGQLTTTTFVENFPGFVEPIMGIDLTEKFKQHSKRYGTRVFTETVTSVDFQVFDQEGSDSSSSSSSGTGVQTPQQQHQQQQPGAPAAPSGGAAQRKRRGPFTLRTTERCVTADAVIIATGASAKRLRFPGSGDESEGGYWNRGISACAICDGSSPLIRNKPVAVVGGGDSAMEEAMFLTRYASKVYIIHRFNYLEASKSMARRALANPKIEVLWCAEVREAHGSEATGNLEAITIARSPLPAGAPVGLAAAPPAPAAAAGAAAGAAGAAHAAGRDGGEVLERLEVCGLFFAIGHRPATDFLQGQLDLDDYGYIVTAPGSTVTSVPGVFAAGDVMDRKYRQAITAAGSGCMAALEAERFLQALDAGVAPAAAAGVAERGEGGMPQQWTASAAAPPA